MVGANNSRKDNFGSVVCKNNVVNMYVYMIVDKIFTYNQKVYFAIICAGGWIYFRTNQCYEMIPRQHIFPVVFVMIWAYLNYYDPLFLPIGLGILILYTTVKSISFDSEEPETS